MGRLTPEQRLQIVEFFYQNNGSIRRTYRSLRPFYGNRHRPSERLIRITMDRFRTTGTVNDIVQSVRRRTVRTEQAVAAVQQSIEEDPNQSIRRRSKQMGLCPSTLWKILRKDLGSSDDDRVEVAITNGGDVQSGTRPINTAAAMGVKQKSARVEAANILKQQKESDELERPRPLKPTGGGRGRPRKNPLAATPSKAAIFAVGIKHKQENGGIAEVPKKRGRPSLGLAKTQLKATPKTISDKPKKSIVNEDQNSDDGGNSFESFKSVEIYNNVGTRSRGHSTSKPSNSGKSVGRPKKLISKKKVVTNTNSVADSPDDKFEDDNDSSSSNESSEISSPKVKDNQLTKITT